MEFSNMMHQCKFSWRAVNGFQLHQLSFAGNFSA